MFFTCTSPQKISVIREIRRRHPQSHIFVELIGPLELRMNHHGVPIVRRCDTRSLDGLDDLVDRCVTIRMNENLQSGVECPLHLLHKVFLGLRGLAPPVRLSARAAREIRRRHVRSLSLGRPILSELDALQLQPVAVLAELISGVVDPFRHVEKAGQRSDFEKDSCPLRLPSKENRGPSERSSPPEHGCSLSRAYIIWAGFISSSRSPSGGWGSFFMSGRIGRLHQEPRRLAAARQAG